MQCSRALTLTPSLGCGASPSAPLADFPAVYIKHRALLGAHTLFKRLENRSLYPQSFPFPPILQISRLKPREAKGLA